MSKLLEPNKQLNPTQNDIGKDDCTNKAYMK